MKTEEQKKELQWFKGSPLDYEVKNLIDPMVSETRAVWAQWWDKHLNGDETYNCGVIKFGLVFSEEIGTQDVFTVFKGFDKGQATWEEWDTEYTRLEWCSLSELNKL